MASPRSSPGRLGALRFGGAALFLLYGLLTFEFETESNGASLKWSLLTLGLYALPLLAQLGRGAALSAYGLWWGVFLLCQTIASQLVGNPHFLTLPPRMDSRIDVRPGALAGIVGVKHVTTDALGFRVQPPVDYAHKRGPRVFVIGGSTTEDIYLDDGETWTHLLQEGLRQRLRQPVEVINTGLSGLRAENHLATLRRVAPLQPDLVVFLLGLNDWNRQIHERFGPPPRTHHPLGDGYRLQNTLLGRIALGLLRRLRPSSARQREEEVVTRANGHDGLSRPVVHSFRPAQVAQSYQQTLRQISALCKHVGVTCLFLTQPTGYREDAALAYRKSFWMTPPYVPYTLDLSSLSYLASLYNGYLLDFARQGGHPAFDLAAQVPPSFASFVDEAHFNEAGAARVAAAVLPQVAAALGAKGSP